jgi:hypothetical protein
MFRRTFADNAPHITFTKTWEQLPFGNLVPGSTVHISYDPDRLPFERSNYHGAPTWSITAFYRFSPNGAISSKQLDTPTGQVVSRYSDDPVEATMMTTSIDIPTDAEELILWFMNTGRSGFQYWDSDYGRNYIFRFTSIDIQGENATVIGDAFEVEITALPVVENVAVDFKVINHPPLAGSVPLIPGAIADGRRSWSVRGIKVPIGANVWFTFTYAVDGRQFVDDNDGAGFYAPKPIPTQNPEKFLAAMAKRAAPTG